MEGNVPDSTWAMFAWPMINTVELEDLCVSMDIFVTFIRKHSTTLWSVALIDITVLQGTWLEPPKEVTKVNKMCHVYLLNLYRINSSGEVSDSLETNLPEMEPEVLLNDSDDVEVASEVFRHHFWTSTSNLPGDPRHLVDLRLVSAAVDGEKGYGHGHWEF